MYTDSEVQITRVANGFIVSTKPDTGKEPSEFIKMIPGLVNQVLGTLAKSDDPEMSGLQDEEEGNDPAGESTVYIFKNWKEVAGFLQLHFEK